MEKIKGLSKIIDDIALIILTRSFDPLNDYIKERLEEDLKLDVWENEKLETEIYNQIINKIKKS